MSCWNIPTQSDCLINLDGPYPFWRWCPAIQTQYSGSAPRIHAHPCCLLLDAFPSLLGPNQSPSQTGSKYQICWFTFYGTRIQHQPSTLPDIASLGNHLPETYSQGSSRQILTSTSATVQLSPADEMPLNPVSPGYQRLSAQLPSSRFLQ